MTFKYKEPVLAELARHGVRPTPETPPELAHQYVNDLYLYEIRAAKERLKQGLIPLSEYAGRIDDIRRRYPVLGLPLRLWTDPR